MKTREEKQAHFNQTIETAKMVADNPAFVLGHIKMFGGKFEATNNKNASATKKGSGRFHVQGNGTGKTDKQKAAGSYARGMRNWCNNKPAKGRV